MKYRLKKDAPEFKAGYMFTRSEDEHGNDCLFADVAPLPAFDISLIANFDEWFEEVEETNKYIGVTYRFTKPFYYDDRVGYIEFEDNPNIVWED